MRKIQHVFIIFMCLLFIVPMTSYSNDELSDEDVSRLLTINDEDKFLVYGEYAEVEITSNQDVDISFADEIIPFGLELEKIDEKTSILYGQVEFLEKLCFLVDARKRNGKESTERLCVYGVENEEISYPNISTQRNLDEIKVNQYNSLTINIDNDQNVNYETTVLGQLPSGLNVTSTTSEYVILTGTISNPGVYEFVVKAQELNSDIVSYKQFSLEVVEQEVVNQCAAGYYWDDYLKYCVQAGGRTCGPGTFYDVSSNSCRAYNTSRACRSGTYYDHFLNRCVISSAMRCPLNYEWDGYYTRCVRLPYTCSFAQKYDYRLRRCVSIFFSRTCSIGSHWDSYYNSCVRNSNVCRYGSYWNGRSCERNNRVCSGNRYYDPSRGRCLDRSPVIVRRPVIVNRTCRNGTRWSGGLNRCVSYDQRRVERHPQRPHRPVVTRPNRDERPNRPTTRPERPNRDQRPTRPTTRPERPNRDQRPTQPTTRPERPNRDQRPTQPTTRPERPNRNERPTQPTTRPERPNRNERPTQPTTRPERPNRNERPTQPTTRPERPNRNERPTQPTTRPDRGSRSSGSSSSGSTTRPDRGSRSSGSSTGTTTRPERPSRRQG